MMAIIQVVLALAILAAPIVLTMRRRKKKSQPRMTGEDIVNSAIRHYLPSSEYCLLDNVTLPHNGITTQIDHIIVSQKGVFVIESKHYRGKVVGGKDDKKWMQVSRWDQREFQNPLRQNHAHIKALEERFPDLGDVFKSLVIFSGDAELGDGLPNNVIYTDDLPVYMAGFKDAILTMDQVYMIIGKIQFERFEVSEETDKMHLQNLKERYGD